MIPKLNYEVYKVCVYKAGDLEAILNDIIYIPENVEKYRIPHEIASDVELRLRADMLTEEERKQAKQEEKTAYNKGLADAWEAARKCLNNNALWSFCDLDPGESMFSKYSAARAIEKIKEYEDEQNAFKSGDVVKYKNDDKHQKFIYLYTDDNGKIARCLIYAKMIDAVVCVDMPLELLEKTGEYINIKEMLK